MRASIKTWAAGATGLLLAASFAPAAWRALSTRRAWAASEAPVAFWVWHTRLPAEEELTRVARATGARTLFVRAGQFDFEDGNVRRIRPAEGRFTRALDVHLVYNGTRSFLANFERVGENALAAAVAETYLNDSARARLDGARVRGLQLDFDSPTRLLPRYARVLRGVRARLPDGEQLSVTGLPTWMGSGDIRALLGEVDFWVPQFYGAGVPERLDLKTPIASASEVARDAARARLLGKPFYAGLSAYGYALLYDARGRLLTLRGDLDHARVARDANFELVERRPFTDEVAEARDDKKVEGRARAGVVFEGDASAAEWRYVYRARADGVVGGLAVRAGESLVFDMPSGASLRAGVRGVRREAGSRLLGICVFRLPEGGREPLTLSAAQIAAALSDRDAAPDTDFQVSRGGAHETEGQIPDDYLKRRALVNHHEEQTLANHLSVRVTNRGGAALFGDDALAVTLRFPRGSLRGVVSLDGFTSAEPLCAASREESKHEEWRPCGLRRAGALRLRATAWEEGASASAVLSFESVPPVVGASVRERADDGRTVMQEHSIPAGKVEGP